MLILVIQSLFMTLLMRILWQIVLPERTSWKWTFNVLLPTKFTLQKVLTKIGIRPLSEQDVLRPRKESLTWLETSLKWSSMIRILMKISILNLCPKDHQEGWIQKIFELTWTKNGLCKKCWLIFAEISIFHNPSTLNYPMPVWLPNKVPEKK